MSETNVTVWGFNATAEYAASELAAREAAYPIIDDRNRDERHAPGPDEIRAEIERVRNGQVSLITKHVLRGTKGQRKARKAKR